jgi:hypothetical protein
VVVEYFQTGLVPRFPTLFGAGFLVVCALLSLAVGLILDTQARARRQNFELMVNLMTSARADRRRLDS